MATTASFKGINVQASIACCRCLNVSRSNHTYAICADLRREESVRVFDERHNDGFREQERALADEAVQASWRLQIRLLLGRQCILNLDKCCRTHGRNLPVQLPVTFRQGQHEFFIDSRIPTMLSAIERWRPGRSFALRDVAIEAKQLGPVDFDFIHIDLCCSRGHIVLQQAAIASKAMVVNCARSEMVCSVLCRT